MSSGLHEDQPKDHARLAGPFSPVRMWLRLESRASQVRHADITRQSDHAIYATLAVRRSAAVGEAA